MAQIQATIDAAGGATVTIDGQLQQLQSPTATDARREVTAIICAAAARANTPLPALMHDSSGDWSLVFHPDGSVSSAEDAPAQETPPAETAPVPQPEIPEDDTVLYNGSQPPKRPRGHRAAQSLPTATEPPQPAAPLPTNPIQAPPPPATPAPQQPTDPEPVPENPAPAGPRHSFLTAETIEEPASRGWRGFFRHLGIRLAPSQEERAERADVQAVSQHWPGPRTIAVVNGKGGASKTPSTVLLSAVFARYGGAGVLAWDNNQTRGTLGWRTEQGPHEATVLELLPETQRLLGTGAQSADLAHYVHHQTADRYDVLRSKPIELADAQRIAAADVDSIHEVASKYYRLIFIDSGNDESDPMWQRMIDHADQLVVATTTRDDHAEAGALLLEALQQRDECAAKLAKNAVTIVSQADPRATKADVSHIVDGYKGLARDVVSVPHDPAMVDGQLTYAALRPATQRAWLAAAAAVSRGLNNTEGTTP